jgi:hypothetical protein
MNKFDFSLTVDSSALACADVDSFYSKAYLAGEESKFIKLIPGVKNSRKVATTTFPSVLQALDCTFAATSSVLSAVTVTVCPLKSNVSICKVDIEDSFIVNQLRAGESNYTWDAYMSHYYEMLNKEIASEIAVLRWQGNTAGTGSTYSGNFLYKTLCDGFEKLLLADSNVIDVTATAVTTSNVISILTAAFNAAPTAVKVKGAGAVFMVASNVIASYRIASALGNSQSYITGDMPLTFAGYPVVEAVGMSDNNIVFSVPTNFIQAFDGSEGGEIISVDQLKTGLGIPNIATTVLLSIGFQIVNGSQVTWVH